MIDGSAGITGSSCAGIIIESNMAGTIANICLKPDFINFSIAGCKITIKISYFCNLCEYMNIINKPTE